MDNVIINIGCICVALCWTEVAHIDVWFKRHLFGFPSDWKRIRPIDCASCMAFWLTFIFVPLMHTWIAIFFPFINTIIVECIIHIKSKY